MTKNLNFMRLILSSLIFFVSACASVGVTQTKQTVAKPEDCPLDIYTSDSEIKRKFEVVCLLDSKTGSTLFANKTVAGAIENARPHACECGGDGMVVGDTRVEGVSMAGWGEGTAMIKVIRYTKPTK